jgi:hypothetical protein
MEHAFNTIQETVEVLHMKKKAKLLNAHERFHMYDLSRQKLHMTDTFTDIHNPTYKLSVLYECIVSSCISL